MADKKCGLWAFRRLQRLAGNAIYDPFDDGRRFKELKNIAKEAKTFVDTLKCPISCEALLLPSSRSWESRRASWRTAPSR
eukprot:2463159-Pyramimonas_sp.AAC.1